MATTSSVASSSVGLDVQSLVSQLMANERRPIDKLNTKVANYQTKISSFGTVSSLVSGFQTAVQGLTSKLQGFSATPSDSSVFTASATSTAAAGIYSINVTTLAQAHKLAAAGQVSDTNAIATGASTVTFMVGTTRTDVAIAAGATLQDIRTAINAANMGVTATIVNDGSATPYRLALSSDNTGTSNAISSITIYASGASPLPSGDGTLLPGDAAVNDLLAYNPNANVPTPAVPMAQTVAAKNADFTVNGIQIIKASNTVTDAIQGVTLTLSKENTTAALTVARDTSAVSTAVSGMVDAYNALASHVKSRSAYGSSTTTAGALAGDGTLRMMQDQLRGIIGTAATGGTLARLSEVGIAFQADGTLKLDSGKLSSAMASNFSDVANLFSSTTGFATRLNAWSTSVLAPDTGLIATRTNSLNTSVKSYNEQISKLEARMTVLQKQYTTTYTNLNMMLNSMNSTSSYLTQQFSKGAA